MPEKSTVKDQNRILTNEDFAGEVFYQWIISEYPEYERSKTWYIAMVLISILLVIVSIFTDNYFLAIIVILFVFILFLRHHYENRRLVFKIAENGVILGQQFFGYDSINRFYIIYNPPISKKLYFVFKGMRPTLSIDLDNMNPLIIRDTLLTYLEEDLEKETESIDDQLTTLLKL